MSLLENIIGKIPEKDHVYISITGGGGKSSLMKDLAKIYKQQGKSVLLTTSTHIQSPVFYDWGADYEIFSFADFADLTLDKSSCVLFGYKMNDDIQRLKSPAEHEIEALKNKFDVVICEADGSRHLPLKFHTFRDPVIFPFSDYTIAVLGAWAYGKEAWEVTFGYDGDRTVDTGFLNAYIEDENGLLKGKPDLVLVNGIDNGLDYKPFSSLNWPKNLKVLGGSLLENSLSFEL